mmetsp:Transcript_22009/g.43755  ORF Transcript_22009/g.43755 Transcript_22009/m.43755 type:complete len:143 (+) Transcript_22009:28-456(+)
MEPEFIGATFGIAFVIVAVIVGAVCKFRSDQRLIARRKQARQLAKSAQQLKGTGPAPANANKLSSPHSKAPPTPPRLPATAVDGVQFDDIYGVGSADQLLAGHTGTDQSNDFMDEEMEGEQTNPDNPLEGAWHFSYVNPGDR